MDRYARQSHKTNQRARRRNNTAQFLLDNHLKQLDRERRSGQVAFQRSLTRVKSELSSLEGASSDFSLPLTNDANRTKNANSNSSQQFNDTEKDARIIRTTDLSGIGDDNTTDVIITKNTTRIKSSKAFLISTPLYGDDVDGLKYSNNNNNYNKYNSNINKTSVASSSSLPCLATSTPTATVTSSPNQFPGTLHRSFTSHNPSSSSCEYNHLNLRRPRRCNHFPCKLPQTYHTLGFRRDDLCPHNGDLELSPRNNSLDGLFETPPDRRFNASRDLDDLNLKPRGDNSNSKTVNTKWMKDHEGPTTEFNPTINGPVFGYRPADPVLERIRQHRKEPKLNAARPCARVTIRDRIRGVKQLVKEMKTSNERIKPQAWATNYGKRVPTRVLLNPVVPV